MNGLKVPDDIWARRRYEMSRPSANALLSGYAAALIEHCVINDRREYVKLPRHGRLNWLQAYRERLTSPSIRTMAQDCLLFADANGACLEELSLFLPINKAQRWSITGATFAMRRNDVPHVRSSFGADLEVNGKRYTFTDQRAARAARVLDGSAERWGTQHLVRADDALIIGI